MSCGPGTTAVRPLKTLEDSGQSSRWVALNGTVAVDELLTLPDLVKAFMYRTATSPGELPPTLPVEGPLDAHAVRQDSAAITQIADIDRTRQPPLLIGVDHHTTKLATSIGALTRARCDVATIYRLSTFPVATAFRAAWSNAVAPTAASSDASRRQRRYALVWIHKPLCARNSSRTEPTQIEVPSEALTSTS